MSREMPRYKIKGRFVPAGVYDIPTEALELALDIERIESALATLRKINETSISAVETAENREFCRRWKSVTVRAVESWRRYAELKLRGEFLYK